MNEFKIELFYKYDGPNPRDLFIEEKDAEQIQEAFIDFENGITQYIDADISTISSFHPNGDNEKKIVSIKSTATTDDLKKAVKQCLQDLDLRAKIL